MKRFLILLIFIVFYSNAFSEEIPLIVSQAIDKGEKYFSNNEQSYIVIVEYSNEIPASESGIFIHTNTYEKYISSPWLVGVGFVLWTPQDNFILIDNGTAPNRGFICLNIKTGSKMGNIGRFADEFVIIGEKYIIATTQEGYRLENLLEQYGVTLYILEDNSIYNYTVFQPEELLEFRFNQFKDDSIIIKKIYLENTNSESPWGRYKTINEVLLRTSLDEILDSLAEK